MKKWFGMLAVILCVVCAVVLLGGNRNASAVMAEELMADTLQELNVSDAVLSFEDDGEGGQYAVYTSAAKGMRYYFYGESGALARIMNDAVTTMKLESEDMAIAPEELRNAALEFASDCIANQRIGELYVSLETISADETTYEITEKYDGIPTGTKLGLIYRNDGVLFACVPHYGSVFVQKPDGRVELAKGDEFIGEEAAKEQTVEAMRTELGAELPDDAVLTVAMDARGEELFYSILVENIDPDRLSMMYNVEIDAYTGEVLGVFRTV